MFSKRQSCCSVHSDKRFCRCVRMLGLRANSDRRKQRKKEKSSAWPFGISKMMSLLSDRALYQISRKGIDYCCLQTAEPEKEKQNEKRNAIYNVCGHKPEVERFPKERMENKHQCLNIKTLQFASESPVGRSNSLPAFLPLYVPV